MMNIKQDRLLLFWEKTAHDLQLQLITPFIFFSRSGQQLNALFLLPQFGADKGMLIFKSYDAIKPHVKEIIDTGYGFSVLDEPLESEVYEIDNHVDVLRDWGWSGDEKLRPHWL